MDLPVGSFRGECSVAMAHALAAFPLLDVRASQGKKMPDARQLCGLRQLAANVIDPGRTDCCRLAAGFAFQAIPPSHPRTARLGAAFESCHSRTRDRPRDSTCHSPSKCVRGSWDGVAPPSCSPVGRFEPQRAGEQNVVFQMNVLVQVTLEGLEFLQAYPICRARP